MSIRRFHPLAAGAAIAALGLSVTAAGAAAATPAADASAAKPTVILVHGAFADASGWSRTAKLLEKDGYKVRTPPNPLRGATSDAATVRAVIDSVKGPKIVVGHSYGGAVISKAAAGATGVRALAYIAAFAPDTGETLGALSARPVAHPVGQLPLVPLPVHQPDGSVVPDLYLNPGKFRARFAADLTAAKAHELALAQRPISAAAFAEPFQGAPAWKTIPSWALIPTADKAIGADLERFMAKRAKARISEVKGASHAVFISEPEATVKLIEKADRGTR